MREDIKRKLLDEAKSSPNLFADLAGLEQYIAESYNNRSFIELLQNADDAGSTKFKIQKNEDLLIVANNGRKFTGQDLESLCRSAASNKVRGQTIGYRGIGFKSVVGFSEEVYVFSGELEFCFSKEKTKSLIPEASKVPLIRIPHEIENRLRTTLATTIADLKEQEYTTIFVFTGVAATQIEMEFRSLHRNSLLFLHNIIEVDLSSHREGVIKLIKRGVSEYRTQIKVVQDEDKDEWLIFEDGDISIAFSVENDVIQRLESAEAQVFSFLPTENETGLGVVINGSFSTDPSRKHIIFDEETKQYTKKVAIVLVNLLKENISLNSELSKSLIRAIIPYTNPTIALLKNSSFEKALITECKAIADPFFEKLLLAPAWLNVKDFTALIKGQQEVVLPKSYYEITGILQFLKFLGANEASEEKILKALAGGSYVSSLGCAEITTRIMKNALYKDSSLPMEHKQIDIFISNQKRRSLQDLEEQNLSLDKQFISQINELGLTAGDIKNALEILIPENNLIPDFDEVEISEEENLLERSKNNWFNRKNNPTYKPTREGYKKWRSAEENCLEVLNNNGFRLVDVSKQNIGYDLEGSNPDGTEIFIEVKSINLIGQKIKLTNNEVAVAQEKKEEYFLAIVRQLENHLEIALISNPVENLYLNRQCVQWVWECSEYEYEPVLFTL
ncbi:protein NO VEIN domain-containing protein [Salinimicrobium sp. CAU 1759]